MTFTANHQGHFYSGEPFCARWDAADQMRNTEWVTLPARLDQDLKWEREIAVAENAVALGNFLLWELDFGLSSGAISFQDSAAFFSFTLAVEEFSKKIYSQFKEKSVGVVIFNGAFSPLTLFPLSQWEGSFSESEIASYPLFCAQILAEYLHRLLSFFPEDVVALVHFEWAPEISSAERAQLFSRERFEFVYPVPTSFPRFCTLGVVLPSDTHLNAAVVAHLNLLLESLSGQPYRIVSEGRLTEEWDGLEELIVLSEAVSVQGKRKLLGFAAAGGIVRVIGEPLNVPGERLEFL